MDIWRAFWHTVAVAATLYLLWSLAIWLLSQFGWQFPSSILAILPLTVSVTFYFLSVVRSYSSSRTTTAIAKNAEARMQAIGESLSTRTLDEFPKHIPEIIKVITAAKRDIVILAEGVDYGSFRDFEAHEKLVAEILLKKQAGVNTKYLIWEPPASMSRANKFRSAEKRVRDKAEFLICVRAFLSQVRKIPEISSSEEYYRLENAVDQIDVNWADGREMRDLEALQIKFHNRQLNRLRAAQVDIWVGPRAGGEASTSNDNSLLDAIPPPPEFYFWVADGDAVFLLPYLGEDAQAFFTRDPALIRNFKKVFGERLRYSKKLRKLSE